MDIRKQFKSAIARGTGEAHLLMQGRPAVDFTNYIQKAALANLAYDPQCEGSRAVYMFELIQLAAKKEKIRKAVLEQLATEEKDHWALAQLFDLAALFALQGDVEARKAIHKRYGKRVIYGADWVGDDALLLIDGMKGLLKVLKRKGNNLRKDPEDLEYRWYVDDFQKKHPDLDVYALLQQAAATDDDIRVYLETILKEPKEREERIPFNYKIVTERIALGTGVPLTPLSAKDLSEADIKRLAADFLKETDKQKIMGYLHVFSLVAFPYDYAPILHFAANSRKRPDATTELALEALRFFQGTDIRTVALRHLQEDRLPVAYLPLLHANYEEGDSAWLTALVHRCRNQHELHKVTGAILDIYECQLTADCAAPLTAIYERTTCGICRHTAVRLMLGSHVLLEHLKAEIKFDSELDTRKLI